jgi:uncharacterized HAD superfamily protein
VRIGIDFDGVITDHGKIKAVHAKRLFGIDVSPDLFKREVIVGERRLLTNEQYSALQEVVFWDPEIGMAMEAVPGALEYIARIHADGDFQAIVTSRTGRSRDIARDWFGMRMECDLDFYGVGPKASKLHVARQLCLDGMIEDDADKLEPLIGTVPHLFLLEQPYNRCTCVEGIERIASWEKLYDRLQNIKSAAQ